MKVNGRPNTVDLCRVAAKWNTAVLVGHLVPVVDRVDVWVCRDSSGPDRPTRCCRADADVERFAQRNVDASTLSLGGIWKPAASQQGERHVREIPPILYQVSVGVGCRCGPVNASAPSASTSRPFRVSLAEDRQEDLVVLIRATHVVDGMRQGTSCDCQGAMPEIPVWSGRWRRIGYPARTRHRNDRELRCADRDGRRLPGTGPSCRSPPFHDSSVKLKYEHSVESSVGAVDVFGYQLSGQAAGWPGS